MKPIIFYIILLLGINVSAQEFYLVNNSNELKRVDITDFSVTDLFQVPANIVGNLTDIAFAPDGRLFGVTNFDLLVEIDLINETAVELFSLPADGTYTGLICDANFRLYTSKTFSLELFSYDLNLDTFEFVEDGISTPGDYTYYKGNLVYPDLFNEFIKAYDGTDILDVGCSLPLMYAFVNVFEDCDTNRVFGIDEDSKVYEYDFENDSREIVADLLSTVDLTFGAASTNEWMASTCPLETLNEIECEPLSNDDFDPSFVTIHPNPVRSTATVLLNSTDRFEYTLLDSTGRNVRNGIIDAGYVQLDLSNLSGGIYFLKLMTVAGDIALVKKVMKE